MLQICPNLLGKKFIDPPFKEEILVFIKKLGYSENMKSLSDAKVETLPQPWRTFETFINKCLSDWHMAKDDPILTTMRFILKHEIVQKYGVVLPHSLTNQAMKESDEEKTEQAPKASPRKRIKATAKVAKSGKKKQPTKGLETLSKVALSEAEEIKTAIKISKTQFHNSQVSSSGAHEGTSVIRGVPDVPTYGSDDEQISWKSSNDEDDDNVSASDKDDHNADDEDDNDQDDDNEQTESDNDGDDFVHPKLSTFNEEERQEEKLEEEEEGSDQRFHIPSPFESTDDEAYDIVTQGDNVEEEKLDEEKINEEEEVNELYNDSSLVSSGFISKMLNPNLDTGIDSILNLNTESTSLADVSVTTNDEIPPSSFEDRLKSLEEDLSEFKQTNLFVEAVLLIPGIVDKYLANQMNEAVKAVVQLQSDRLREEAHAKNEDFINKIDENIKKIIKQQVKVQVKEQVSKILTRIEKFMNEKLKAEVLIYSSNEAKTSHAVAPNLSELELKKILIDKMENVEMMRMKTNNPPLDQTEGPREEELEKDLEEEVYTVKDLEELAHQEFETGFTEDHTIDEITQHPDWF
nr:hypothetical protein [Tanacetum cinerariifolium]